MSKKKKARIKEKGEKDKNDSLKFLTIKNVALFAVGFILSSFLANYLLSYLITSSIDSNLPSNYQAVSQIKIKEIKLKGDDELVEILRKVDEPILLKNPPLSSWEAWEKWSFEYLQDRAIQNDVDTFVGMYRHTNPIMGPFYDENRWVDGNI